MKIEKRFITLLIFDSTELSLALVRSILNRYVYIEIKNTFVISCKKSIKDKIANTLNESDINFLLIYTNHKSGTDVYAKGLNIGDMQRIEAIVFDK